MYNWWIAFKMLELVSWTIVLILQKVDSVEEAFNDFLVRHKDASSRLSSLEKELGTLMNEAQGDSQDAVLKQYFLIISTVNNDTHSKLLFGLLENLVSNNTAISR